MKKLIIILGVLMTMSVNALTLDSVSFDNPVGVWIPSGISQDKTGTTHDYSEKFQKDIPTINIGLSQEVMVGNKSMIVMRSLFSTGHRSEVYKVSPYFQPSIEFISQVNDDVSFRIGSSLKTFGGDVSEQMATDEIGVNFSFITADLWSSFNMDDTKVSLDSKTYIDIIIKF